MRLPVVASGGLRLDHLDGGAAILARGPAGIGKCTAAAAEGDCSSAWVYLSRLHREADPAFHPAQALWSLSHLAYAALQPGRS